MTKDVRDETFARGVAVVTGGSGAIGGAIARALASAGAEVIITYRSNADAADAVAKEISDLGGTAAIQRLDLADPARVAAFADETVARHGHVHSVVYGAGPKIPLAYINAIDPQDWAKTLNADVNGCFNLFRAFLPHLKKQGTGSLLAVTTAAVDKVPQRDILSAAPKAAIETLIRGIAKEEGRYGIRANAVAPGLLDEGIGRDFIADGLSSDLVDRFRKSIPMKRFAASQEIAEAALFLLSSKAGYITGQALAVDGGMQL